MWRTDRRSPEENEVETSKRRPPLRCDVQAVILGTGGLGRIITLELASDPRVEEIVIADKRGDRSRALKSLGKTATIQALEADVKDPYALRRVLADADVAVNATLPEHNIRIMEACLEVGCSYVDTSGYSPRMPGEKGGVLDQLGRDAAWRERGLTAIVSMGSDPGLSNVMARVASEQFATIDRVLVRKAATGEKETDGFPLYSREIFLHDALTPPVIWDGTGFVEREPVSGEEDYAFPAPIGKRHVHLFRHEEVFTLPQHMGKPIGWVDYKHDIRPELVQAILAFHALGLLDPHHTVKIGTVHIPFRRRSSRRSPNLRRSSVPWAAPSRSSWRSTARRRTDRRVPYGHPSRWSIGKRTGDEGRPRNDS